MKFKVGDLIMNPSNSDRRGWTWRVLKVDPDLGYTYQVIHGPKRHQGMISKDRGLVSAAKIDENCVLVPNGVDVMVGLVDD